MSNRPDADPATAPWSEPVRGGYPDPALAGLTGAEQLQAMLDSHPPTRSRASPAWRSWRWGRERRVRDAAQRMAADRAGRDLDRGPDDPTPDPWARPPLAATTPQDVWDSMDGQR